MISQKKTSLKAKFIVQNSKGQFHQQKFSKLWKSFLWQMPNDEKANGDCQRAQIFAKN
jgi:hypothetical protein